MTAPATGPTRVPGARAVFALAWPMTLKAIFLHGTVVIDGWLVSPLGESSLAALGLAAAVGGFITGVLFAFSNALQIRTAQAFGTGDAVFRKSALASGLAFGAFIAAVGILAVFAFGRPLLAALAPDGAIAAQAWSYLWIFTFVIAAEAIGQNAASHFNGCGRARVPLYGYALSVPINVIASSALIHGLWGLPEMGVAGAATGSAIAISVQAAYLGIRLWGLDRDLARSPGWQRGSFRAALGAHLRFAWPIAVTFVSSNFAARVGMLIYAQMSIAAFAAMTLIIPWIMVGGTIGMQWAQATGIVVAQLLGERRSGAALDQFLRAAWRGSFGAAGLVAACYMVICLLPDVLYPGLSPETRSILTGFAPILLVLPFPKQSNAICGNTLRASGDTLYVMRLFLAAQWAFHVPATVLFVLVLPLAPFWVLSLLFWEEILKFLPFHRRLLRGDWKRSDVAA